MRRIFWKRVISGMELMEGYQIPRGWGISYREYPSDHLVIHLIPLNYIVATARWLLWKISVPYFVNLEKERISGESLKSYNRGWENGKRHVEYLVKKKWEEAWEEFVREAVEIIQREHEETKHLNETNK